MLLLLFEVPADKLLHSPDRPASGFQALSAASLDMIEFFLSQTVLSFLDHFPLTIPHTTAFPPRPASSA